MSKLFIIYFEEFGRMVGDVLTFPPTSTNKSHLYNTICFDNEIPHMPFLDQILTEEAQMHVSLKA
ncbi:hypothetical protein LXL04_010806 [Taraxacum kok-saghyz]